jgi:hypothetical protein
LQQSDASKKIDHDQTDCKYKFETIDNDECSYIQYETQHNFKRITHVDPVDDIPCLLFNNKHNIIVCSKCSCALTSKQCQTHFRSQHDVEYKENDLNSFLDETHIQDLNVVQQKLVNSIDLISQIDGLIIEQGFKCSQCNKLTTSNNKIQSCRKSHSESVSICKMQRLTKQPQLQSWFEVCIVEYEEINEIENEYDSDEDDEKQQEQIEIDNEAKRLINDAFNFSHDGIVYERAKALDSLGNLDVKSRSIVYSTWGFHDVSELVHERIDDILAAIKPSRKKTPAERILQVMCYSYFAHGDALLKSSQLHLKQRLISLKRRICPNS